MRWFRKRPPVDVVEGVPPPSGEEIVMAALPLVLGNNPDPVKYAKYRLSAIQRHIEHNPGTLKGGFIEEARGETFGLLKILVEANEISTDDMRAALARVGAI